MGEYDRILEHDRIHEPVKIRLFRALCGRE